MAEYIPIMRLLRVHETYHDPSQVIVWGFLLPTICPVGLRDANHA